jgi:type III secretion protein L
MAIGKVIKSDAPPEPAQDRDPRPPPRAARAGVVNAEVYEAHQEAANIVAAARQRAEEITEVARAERAKALVEAREQGRQEGLAQVTETLLKARAHRDQLIAGAEREAVALACKIAEKIIGKDLERSPEVVINICATVIDNVRNVAALTVRVNPRDAAILRDHKKQLMELIGRVKDIAIREDSDVPPAGCIIETDSGTIDAQLSTQLEMIQRVLLADNGGRDEGPA